MNQEHRHLLALNLSNAAKIGRMQHSDYLNIGVGNVVYEICAYIPLGQQWMLYAVEVSRHSKQLSLTQDISFEHAINIFAEHAIADFK